jgi:hypothetical protein
MTEKESWFRRVVYKNKEIGDSVLRELAEAALLRTWELFNDNGRQGKPGFDKMEYTSYLFVAFKGNYLESLEKELRRVEVEKESGDRAQSALSRISPDCRQLLVWKHIEGLSHDEIARRKNINRSSSIKMLSRCGRRFSEIWRDINHKTE